MGRVTYAYSQTLPYGVIIIHVQAQRLVIPHSTHKCNFGMSTHVHKHATALALYINFALPSYSPKCGESGSISTRIYRVVPLTPAPSTDSVQSEEQATATTSAGLAAALTTSRLPLNSDPVEMKVMILILRILKCKLLYIYI